MDSLRIMALCVAAAMVCAVIRTQRPELAMAVSLAAGLAAIAAMARIFREQTGELLGMWRQIAKDSAGSVVLRAAGIAVIAEMGVQLCIDAGERAMAGRIALASRLAILALCLPILSDIAEALGKIMP